MHRWRPAMVLFDYGNVLAWFEPRRFVAGLLRGTPRDHPREIERVWCELRRHTALGNAFERGEMTPAEFRQAVQRVTGTALGARRFDRAFNDIFTRSSVMERLVVWLRPRCRLGLLSNTNAIHTRLEILANPLLQCFDQITLSNRVGAMKPEPAIYDHVLRQAGLPAAEILYLDDIPAYVAAARRFGMRAWCVTDHARIAARVRRLFRGADATA